ncbi:MAG: thiamine phosphate synthase [Lactobacillales bacterium]|nr:thiamine phosphate synthase [Lactobacillales bacterium]
MLDLSLYLVTDSYDYTNEEFLWYVEEAIKGGVTLVQLREKFKSGREIYDLARATCELCHRYNVPFLVDDRVDIALAVGADGVHVGQTDLPAAEVRKLIGPDKILGVTAKNLEHALQAERDGADYVGTGAIFPTTTKVVTVRTPLATLEEINQNIGIKQVAIGGINPLNMHELYGSGADGIAVVSAIMKDADPQGVAREMRTQWTIGTQQ